MVDCSIPIFFSTFVWTIEAPGSVLYELPPVLAPILHVITSTMGFVGRENSMPFKPALLDAQSIAASSILISARSRARMTS